MHPSAILRCVATWCAVLQRGALCCNAVRCVATRCAVLQRGAILRCSLTRRIEAKAHTNAATEACTACTARQQLHGAQQRRHGPGGGTGRAIDQPRLDGPEERDRKHADVSAAVLGLQRARERKAPHEQPQHLRSVPYATLPWATCSVPLGRSNTRCATKRSSRSGFRWISLLAARQWRAVLRSCSSTPAPPHSLSEWAKARTHTVRTAAVSATGLPTAAYA